MKTFAMRNHFYPMEGYERPQDYTEQAAMLRANGVDGYYFNLGRDVTVEQLSACVAACENEGVDMTAMYWIVDLRKGEYANELAHLRKLLEGIPDGTPLELGLWDMTGEIKPSSDEGLELSKQFIQDFLPDCQSKNCLLSPYPHFNFNVETTAQCLDIIESCGGNGMKPVASAFHSYVANEDWFSMVKKDPSAFQSISICGISKPGEVADHAILPLGQGDLIDCKQIVQDLKGIGYDGWIGVQAYSVKGDSSELVANTGSQLREYLGSS